MVPWRCKVLVAAMVLLILPVGCWAKSVKKDSLSLGELERIVFAFLNRERVERGSPPLKWSETVAKAARLHSRQMGNNRHFSHQSPNGDNSWDRLRKAGISYRKMAENILYLPQAKVQRYRNGAHERSEFYSLKEMAREAVKGWMGSSGHRSNILDPDFKQSGIGAALGSLDGERVLFLTQIFVRS